MSNLLKRYKEFAGGRPGDYAYYLWHHSECSRLHIPTVPIKIEQSENKVSKYSEQGLKDFFPWFLSESSSSENIGYLTVVTQILRRLHSSGNTKSYTFFRGDCNIFMPWLRVR